MFSSHLCFITFICFTKLSTENLEFWNVQFLFFKTSMRLCSISVQHSYQFKKREVTWTMIFFSIQGWQYYSTLEPIKDYLLKLKISKSESGLIQCGQIYIVCAISLAIYSLSSQNTKPAKIPSIDSLIFFPVQLRLQDKIPSKWNHKYCRLISKTESTSKLKIILAESLTSTHNVFLVN